MRDIIKHVRWLAGLLEGEGCFNYRYDRDQPRVTLEMTDRDVVQRVARMFGANVSRRRPRRTMGTGTFTVGWTKESFQTAIHGDRAIDLMKIVKPFMGTRRRAKISEILRLCRDHV